MQEYMNKYSYNHQLFCCPFMCPYLRYQRSFYRRQWYLHKMKNGFCEINPSKEWPDSIQPLGPFNLEIEAIEKRVELSKQGTCISDIDPNSKYYVHKLLQAGCVVGEPPKDFMTNNPEVKIEQSWGPYDTYDEALVNQYHLNKQKICNKPPGVEW